MSDPSGVRLKRKPNNLYFDIQARLGISKHLYGLKGTRELCNLCQVDSTKSVLVIGSGNGASACQIARLYGSKVLGVDIHPQMVAFAREYCRKKKTEVDFLVGDALNLCLESDTFDVVISESVTAFVGDKKRAIQEYRRVTRKGGYIGLGEVTWLGEPSQADIDFSHDIMGGLDPELESGWEDLLTANGLEIIVARAEKLKKMKQALGELQMMSLVDYGRVCCRFLVAYVTDPAYRSAVHHFARASMKRPPGYLTTFGAGLYVARKKSEA